MTPVPARPGLRHLARAYFHQDYAQDAPTPLDIVRQFADGEPPAAVGELASEVASVLDSSMTDAELRTMWIDHGHAYYDPQEHGIGYRQWFASVLEILERQQRLDAWSRR